MTVTAHTLFEQHDARLSDPETSHAAAAANPDERGRHRALALRVLRDNPAGLTDFELADLTGVQQTSIGKRRKDLERAGLVRRTLRTRPSPSGRASIVWQAVQP